MFYLNIILCFLTTIVPVLICVAFLTLLERKILARIQRRQGPTTVGFFGILQPFADGFKLFLKETIKPSQSDKFIFFLSPILTLWLSLLGWVILPIYPSNINYNFLDFNISDFPIPISNINLGLLYVFTISSLAVYGIILAGWSSNSKYAFLGSLRSAAQMVSYEVSIGLILISLILCVGSLNLSDIILFQQSVWFIISFFPIFLMFFISALAETNRPPFDLPEAEAELVSGYNVEYSAVGFAFFFIGEYANIIFMSTLCVIFFFGGWLLPFFGFNYFFGIFSLAVKVFFFLYLFIAVRAALPRYRYDQLMKLGWKIFLPLSLVWVLFVSSVLLSLDFYPLFTNFSIPLLVLKINFTSRNSSFNYVARRFIMSDNNKANPKTVFDKIMGKANLVLTTIIFVFMFCLIAINLKQYFFINELFAIIENLNTQLLQNQLITFELKKSQNTLLSQLAELKESFKNIEKVTTSSTELFDEQQKSILQSDYIRDIKEPLSKSTIWSHFALGLSFIFFLGSILFTDTLVEYFQFDNSFSSIPVLENLGSTSVPTAAVQDSSRNVLGIPADLLRLACKAQLKYLGENYLNFAVEAAQGYDRDWYNSVSVKVICSEISLTPEQTQILTEFAQKTCDRSHPIFSEKWRTSEIGMFYNMLDLEAKSLIEEIVTLLPSYNEQRLVEKQAEYDFSEHDKELLREYLGQVNLKHPHLFGESFEEVRQIAIKRGSL